jgi:NAD(P)H dehydrogenase (quinone)
MYAVTGASGQLGRLVVAELLKTVPAGQVVAVVRDPSKVADLAAKGVVVRQADYSRPETLAGALAGADKVLLISGNEVGRRVPQHKAVFDAAKAAGAKLVGYTSVLRADRSKLGVAEEHLQTEQALKASGAPWVLLRNGWYTENYLGNVAPALQYGAITGASGEGRISAATRADYAAGAAAILTSGESQAGRTYELAGDDAFTMAGFAAELSRQSGKPVAFRNLSEAELKAQFLGFGLPEPIAEMLARSDAAAAEGDLYDDSHQLSRLIGRPTTPLKDVLAKALAG